MTSQSVFFREENEVVPQVVQAILTLPPETHIAVRYTSTQLLGELSEWIERHPQLLGQCRLFMGMHIVVWGTGRGWIIGRQ